MSAHDDGGPAFPIADNVPWNGMSLRDYFAARMAPAVYAEADDDVVFADVARAAYHFADAMLAERAKGRP